MLSFLNGAKYLDTFVEIIHRTAQNHNLHFLDLFGEKALDLFQEGKRLFTDGLHLNGKGQEVLANLICEYLLSVK